MQTLSNIIRKIEAGGEEHIREQLDVALGMWSADNGSAHRIMAVSEDSVAFCDDETNLYIAAYAISEGVVVLSKIRRLLNVVEQAGDVSHLDKAATDIIEAIVSDRETEVDAAVKHILELKGDAMRALEMATIADPDAQLKAYKAKATETRFAISQEARAFAKAAVFEAAREIRRFAAPAKVQESVDKLAGLAVNLIAATEAFVRAPVTEGFVMEAKGGMPWMMRKKGGKHAQRGPAWSKDKAKDKDDVKEAVLDEDFLKVVTEAEKKLDKVEVHVYDAPADKDVKGKFSAKPRHTGKGFSVRHKGKSYRLHGDTAKGKGKIFLGDRAYLGIANRKNAIERREKQVAEAAKDIWACSECGGKLMGSSTPCPKHPSAKAAKKSVMEGAEGTHFEVKAIGDGQGTWEVVKCGPNGVMDSAGKHPTEGAAKAAAFTLAKIEEGVVVANLAAPAPKGFIQKAGVSWAHFRTHGICAEGVEVLQRQGTATELVTAEMMLVLCSEAEVYDLLAPHLDAFDPASIRTYVKQVAEVAKGEEAIKARDALLLAFGSQRLTESMLIDAGKGALSKQLDALFLEGDQFDFGAADDLGSDDLDNDLDTKGLDDAMQADDGLGDEQLDDGLGGMDGEMGAEPIQFELPADQAREDFAKILDVIGNEIEDDEDFQELKAKIEDPQQELASDDVVAILQVIGDYFRAVGKDAERGAEAEEDRRAGNETMDDMENQGGVAQDDAAAATAKAGGNPGEGGPGNLDDIGMQ